MRDFLKNLEGEMMDGVEMCIFFYSYFIICAFALVSAPLWFPFLLIKRLFQGRRPPEY